ncbi:MAG TPA: hypothetical protein VIE86_06015 [Nitrososphaera sp.]
MSEEKKIWQLKEAAKWADDIEAKKTAINELSSRGETAISTLEEILNVAMHEDIKKICIDAIKAIKEKKENTEVQKKDEAEGVEAKKELRLADLPP